MPTRSRVVVALALASMVAGLAARAESTAAPASASEAEPRMPGPSAGARARARLDTNEDCVGCHEEVAREWAGSSHARAYEDPLFQVAFERERRSGFCQGCHAPEADPEAPASARAGAVGVGCVSCHLGPDGETVLAGPGSATAPHALHRTARFAGPEACAGCHEFAFPDARADPELLMQRTLSEHQASAFADRSCQSCHMPQMGGEGKSGHAGHRFVVDASLLASAASIRARWEPGAVLVELRPGALGHAFPTGDLFRRLVVEVEAREGGWSEHRVLGRRFDLRREDGVLIKVERADTRVGVSAGPTLVRIEVPAKLDEASLRWSVSYERVLDSPIGASDQAEVWDRRELASGLVER